ncbi:MAG: sugar phosphate isomerase/epimerase [Clostridiales bacterium]|nr:sugar phosphate isomerase/epimerase [Candidatus Coliplasma caballi]
MKTCISTYSFSGVTYNGKMTYPEVLEKTKALGCSGVEFVVNDTAPDGSDLAEFWLKLAEQAKKLELEVPIYTTGANFFQKDPEKEVERVKKHVDLAAACGIKLMRHDVMASFYEGYEGPKTFAAVLPVVAPAIREVAEYAASKGVMTCSENHGRIVQDSERMLAVFAAVNHPNYRYLCDIGNFGGVDEDCAIAVSKLLPLIEHVHVKDAFWRSGMLPNPGRGWNKTRAGNYRRATIFGQGDAPTYQCVRTILESGYKGYFSLEFEGIEDTLLAIEISMENLHRMLKELGA